MKKSILVENIEGRLKQLKLIIKDPANRGEGYWEGYRQALLDVLAEPERRRNFSFNAGTSRVEEVELTGKEEL